MTTTKQLSIAKQVLKKLESVNWDFDKKTSRGDITSLHPYPARFIPSIPDTIIEAVKEYQTNLKVLDPFGGCGTTLSSAQSVGAQAIGIDVNGLANFLQVAYTTSYNEVDLDAFKKMITTIKKSLTNSKPVVALDIPNLDHWFDEETIQIVQSTVALINKEKKSPMAKIMGLLAVSRILVSISRQKSDTQYVAVDKKLTFQRKKDILLTSLDTVLSKFELEKDNDKNSALCIHGDSRDAESYANIDKVNLVITSPPYPNAYEYWLYHKYRMYWLGMDPIYSRTNEIGVRPHYSGSGKKDEWDFYADIKSVLSNIDTVTTPDALQFWVVGQSIIKGKAVNNTKIVIDAAAELGWKNIATFHRNISRKRSSFQGIGNKEFEDIIVLSR